MMGHQENPNKRDRRGDDDDDDGFPPRKLKISPPADTKRLKVKIGGKKLNGEEEEEASPEKKDHVCAECNKRFSSGKALGGHMSSAHVQANRDYCYKRNQLRGSGAGCSKVKDDDGHEESAREYYRGKDGIISCSLCGKKFPSRKSLFGHMRCHPERFWRGMEPPPSTQSLRIQEQEEEEEEDYWSPPQEQEEEEVRIQERRRSQRVLNLVSYLWSWAVTAKRERSPIMDRHVSSSISDSDDQLHEVAAHLNSLRNGSPKLEISHKGKEKSSPHEEDEDNNDTFKNTIYSPSTSMATTTNPPNASLDRKDSKEKAVEKMILTENCDKFKCNICNKCFPSHQALGGHRSSHNKQRVIIQNAIDDECINAIVTRNGEANNNDVSINLEVIHQCTVCNKIFATRRALGGHKKCHSTIQSSPQADAAQSSRQADAAQSSQQADAAQSSQQAAAASNEESSHHPKILDFDLNEIPNGDIDQCD